MRYEHVQSAPLYLLLVVVGVGMLGAAWLASITAVKVVLLCSGALMFLLAASIRQLTVRDAGDHLLIQFGPLPLFRRRIWYAEIDRAERSRTTVFDGWGVHLSPSGGWTWNLWGFDCVDVYYNHGKKVRIGTDDAARLEEFLQHRIAHRL